MDFPFYTGRRNTPEKEGHATLPRSRKAEQTLPRDYLPDDGLRDAVNVALLLNQPLLLTGEPGTGKTQLAYSVAWELDFGEPLKFETKSTSESRDLFYTYDSIGRFHAAFQSAGNSDALDHLTYNALGTAILRAIAREEIARYLPAAFHHDGPRRSVVLIDEIDKATRDFPNDVLNEIEGMYFRIPEIDNQPIKASDDLHPTVIVTSNSEKHLPDAFLRRCVYYHIPFPDKDVRMPAIVTARLGRKVQKDSPFLHGALDIFYKLRDPNNRNIRKKPATSELLGWLLALRDITPDEHHNPLDGERDVILSTVGVLVKTESDHREARTIIGNWLHERHGERMD